VPKKSIKINGNAGLAAASIATKKPAHVFLIPGPNSRRFGGAERSGHNPQSAKDHEIPPKFRGQKANVM